MNPGMYGNLNNLNMGGLIPNQYMNALNAPNLNINNMTTINAVTAINPNQINNQQNILTPKEHN
jgi:hypothetical protein